MLSVVIPAFNEEGNIERTYNVVSSILNENSILFEIVFVNDGSKDGTWDKLMSLASVHNDITAVSFSRNFGKESAVFAGLDYAKGDACVVMDCDLQHPPETIVKMYNIWKNNDIDVVEAVKSNRGKENLIYKICAKTFYRLIKKSSGLDMKGSSDFKLMDRKVVDCLRAMPERLTFFRAMSSWVGFKTEKIEFEVAEREIGKTKWSVRGLIKYAVNSVTSFTSSPLQIVTFFGVVLFIISVILAINTLVHKISGRALEGFSTVILLQLFTSSIIMFSLGIIGYYLSKIYEEIKQRPKYIVGEVIKSKVNNAEDKNEK